MFSVLTSPSKPPPAQAKRVETAANLLPRFPDFGSLPKPGDYNSRIFKLSQDFPAEKPQMEPAIQKILSIDYTKDWQRYMEAVRDYIYEGNIEAEGVANDFYLEENKVRRWYHVPWQHYGPYGREGIHALTKEGPVNPYVLGPTQPSKWHALRTWKANADKFALLAHECFHAAEWMLNQTGHRPSADWMELPLRGGPRGDVGGCSYLLQRIMRRVLVGILKTISS
jgi:hypothetical protein